MSGTNGQACPECAAPREPDGSPSCACTRRAADALRDARTAEQAAAEDFDPLRIRPYVGLEATGSTDEAPTLAVPTATPVPAPPVPAPAPDGTDPGPPAEEAHADPFDERPRGRRRRTTVLAAGGAVAAVVVAAGFASGLFTYGKPERNDALPDEVRPSVPAGSSTGAPTASAETSAAPARTAAPSASARTSETPSPSTSTSASPSPTPSATRTPSGTPTTVRATGSVGPTSGTSGATVLRPGDEGPEVTEVQLRLRQLLLYLGEADGEYDNDVEAAVASYQNTRGITEDPRGTYGQTTRTRLESETKEP